MAGIYDRLGTNDNVPVHTLTAALVAGAAGWFTDVQIRDALNARIDAPLDAQAQADLLAIKAQILSFSDSGDRGEYMHKLESIGLIMESTSGGAFDETTFRSHLGI